MVRKLSALMPRSLNFLGRLSSKSGSYKVPISLLMLNSSPYPSCSFSTSSTRLFSVARAGSMSSLDCATPHTLQSGFGGCNVSVLMTRAADRSRNTCTGSTSAWRVYNSTNHSGLAEIIAKDFKSL